MAKNKFNVNQTLPRFDLTGTKNDELNSQGVLYNVIYNNHINYLTLIVTNLFTWSGLPNDVYDNPIKSSFVESQLALRGNFAVAMTKKYGLVITPCNVIGSLNLWGNPNEIQLQSPFGTESDLSSIFLRIEDKSFVYGRNDNLANGFNGLIYQTAKALSDIFMSILSNANQQKFPVILSSDKESKLTMEFLKNKVDAWEQYILIKNNGSFEGVDFDIVNKNVPFVCDKLYQTYTDIINNFFMRIGINMIPNAKKERMLVDEVNANNQAVKTAGDIYLSNRQEICETVERIFGLRWKVERNSDFIESLKNISTPLDNISDFSDTQEEVGE